MEPVHGGRDDRVLAEQGLVLKGPQWSPSTEDGTTYLDVAARAVRKQPQWSPSTEDGTTAPFTARLERVKGAAMEPVHGGRDDSAVVQILRVVEGPQWSPSTEDGTTGQHRAHAQPVGHAAMEPVHGGRDDNVIRWRFPHRQQAAMEPVHGGRDDRLASTSRPSCL